MYIQCANNYIHVSYTFLICTHVCQRLYSWCQVYIWLLTFYQMLGLHWTVHVHWCTMFIPAFCRTRLLDWNTNGFNLHINVLSLVLDLPQYKGLIWSFVALLNSFCTCSDWLVNWLWAGLKVPILLHLNKGFKPANATSFQSTYYVASTYGDASRVKLSSQVNQVSLEKDLDSLWLNWLPF